MGLALNAGGLLLRPSIFAIPAQGGKESRMPVERCPNSRCVWWAVVAIGSEWELKGMLQRHLREDCPMSDDMPVDREEYYNRRAEEMP